MKYLVLAATVVFGLATLPATAAFAAESVDDQISYALAAVPGGTQTAWNQVTWPDGTTFIAEDTDGSPTPAAATNCSSGKFCAHSEIHGAGSRLEFSTCPSTNGVSALPRVRSVSNARTSGTVTGLNGTTIIVTVAPATTKNVTKTINKVNCA